MTSGGGTWTGNECICTPPPFCKPSQKHAGTPAWTHLKRICFQTRKCCFRGGQPLAWDCVAPGGTNAHGRKVCLNGKIME